MAMYYYASKLSVVACGIRCRQTIRKNNKSSNNRKKLGNSPDDEDNYTNKDKEVCLNIKYLEFLCDYSPCLIASINPHSHSYLIVSNIFL